MLRLQTSLTGCCWQGSLWTAWRGPWRTAPRAALRCTWRRRRATPACWTSCCSLRLTRAASTSLRATRWTLPCCTATWRCARRCWRPAAGSQTDQVGGVGCAQERGQPRAPVQGLAAQEQQHLRPCTRPAQHSAQPNPLACLRACAADYADCPLQPTGEEPGAAQLALLHCLASQAPLQHAAFAGLTDGSELVADPFRLSFAECAARGEPAGPWRWAKRGRLGTGGCTARPSACCMQPLTLPCGACLSPRLPSGSGPLR